MKDTNKAESHYLESIKYYKDNSIPYCGLGSIYFSRRKYNKAIEMYEKQMDTHNYASNRYNNIDISLNLLTCYMIVENYESSIGFGEALRDIFTSKFDLSDRDIFNYFVRLQCILTDAYFYSKNYNELLQQTDVLLSYFPRNVKFNRNIQRLVVLRDIVYKEILQKDEYLDSLNVLYNKFPDYKDLLFSKAIFLDNLDRRKESLQCYLELLKYEKTYIPYNFDYATVYNNVAWNYCLQGLYEKALPYVEKSISLNTKYDYSWETLGEIYYNLKRYNDCIKAMTNAIDLGKSGDAYKYRGLSKIALGDNIGGNEDIEKSKKL
ncbi:MAG: tetratricopeptide repeat protein [Bacteroidales bacterium]|nr:tetratricopeptide repeat protein [Bacteroidales bacterium]